MIKAVICDDEPVFVNKLELFLETYAAQQDIKIDIQKYYDAESLLNTENIECDIIFLDVMLGSVDGITVAKELRKRKIDSIIIYISAYLEKAPQGYEVNAFRYLLKSSLEHNFQYTLDAVIEEIQRRNTTYKIKTQGKVESVDLKNIIYFESFKRYVEIHTKDSVYKEYRKISELEKELEDKGFIRNHKSYLLNMRYISFFKNREIYLENGEVFPCSRSDYQDLKRKYILWRGRYDG